MKRTIEIEVPDGKKAVWKDNNVVFENVKPKLPKTWEEFCYKHPQNDYYINNNSKITAIRSFINSFSDKDSDKNKLPSYEAAKQHLALMQLHQLRDCYRQGWEPDWNDINSYKYCICRYRVKEYYVISFLGNARFLSFKSREIAEKFLNNFRELIEEAGDLI